MSRRPGTDETMRDRGAAAITRLTIDDASPYAASEALAKRMLSLETHDEARLRFWQQRVPGSRLGDDRYRWEISHRRCKGGSHVPPRETWRLLRPEAERDLDGAELRLSLPLSIVDGCEYLAQMGERGAAMLAEAVPVFRRDLATHIQAQNPWSDTFALRCVTRRPSALERLRPIAVALAATYAPLAEDGFVRGMRFPVHERPLVSATAQLASSLCMLGLDIALAGGLLESVRAAQHESGGFGDELPDRVAERFGREDLLTTLVATEALSALDPSFDPSSALAWMGTQQREDGFFVAFGPELGWLTGEVVQLADAAARAFAERFRFPQVPEANLDRKTSLPFYAYYDDLSRFFAALPGLASASVPVAFLDLAGFGTFNNAFGQDMGDAVLALLARELDVIPFARPIRDGGDELLVVGAPARTHLDADLDAFRKRWPRKFHETFGEDVPPVAPRILWTPTRGDSLRQARERLGRGMGGLKSRAKQPPPDGAMERLGVE